MSLAALRTDIVEKLAASPGAIIVALSGGGDSVALAHLLAERFGAERLRALIVDHALREGSAHDAEAARAIAASLGVVAEIATLEWRPGEARGQQGARQKRYAVLCAAARRFGANVIVTGHNADDQAETVLMRAARGSTWRGLAGMSAWVPAPIWPHGRGLILARPLLDARRLALRDFLRERGARWIEDPANTNPNFARVRARARLAEMEGEGFAPTRLAALAARLRPPADALDVAAADLVARAARFEGDEIEVAAAAWRGDEPVRQRALSALIAAAAGASREPEGEALARLAARMEGPAFRGAALGGARVSAVAGGFRLGRDPGALEGRAGGPAAMAALALPRQIETVWDGRLALTPAEDGWSVAMARARPVLERRGERVAIADAAKAGIAAAWLLEVHVDHRLGPAKPSVR